MGKFVKRVRVFSMNRLVLLLSIWCGLVLTACLNIPLGHVWFDQIRAVSWTDDGAPIALAARWSVHKGAYPLTPDGPGIFTSYSDNGMVLLVGKKRENLKIPDNLKKRLRNYELGDVYSFQSGQFFLAYMSDPYPSGSIWLKVGFDGSVSEFDISIFDHPESFETTSRPGFSDLFSLRDFLLHGPKEKYVYVPETQSFQVFKFPLMVSNNKDKKTVDWATKIQNSSYLAYSHDGKFCALPACVGTDKRERRGLWVVRVDGKARFLYPGCTWFPWEKEHKSLKDFPYYYSTHSDTSLAWSPDGRLVYWCFEDTTAGDLIPVNPIGQIRVIRPALKMAVWSPDGTHIAGVADHKLKVIRVTQIGNEAVNRTRK